MDVDEVSIGKPMEVDLVPAQRCPVFPCPAWNVDAADYAPAKRWRVSPALIVGGTRVSRRNDKLFLTSNRRPPDLITNDRWLKISQTPGWNIYNESDDDNDTDYSSLCMGYSPSEDEDVEDSLPEIDFAEADTSLNWPWAPRILTSETPRRIQRTKLFSPLSPVRRSKLDEGDLFITSKRQTADLITKNTWLKTSRTPGRNIHNESVFCDNEYADYSYLALAYPLVEDSDTTAA
ncbi:hypothetical protein JOM56_008135 [Amanita muscaria]